MNIQLSFQGGGARLALLLAAADAVKEMDGTVIRITRIAGTSAGAIVGAFLAGNLDLNRIRLGLAGDEGRALLKKFKVPKNWLTKRWAALRAAAGKRMWDDTPLGDWIRKQFEPVGDAVQIEHLKKPLIVYATNLDGGAPKKHKDGPLVSALLESAGLPFCFRTWKSGGHTISVDGGLCENLPVEDLIERAEAEKDGGRVVAFSFPSAWKGRPGTFHEFAGSLLSVAIDHSVELVRARLGTDSVCILNPKAKITTFDFAEAFAFLASEEYDILKKFVRGWFQNLVASTRATVGRHRTTDVWSQTKNTDLREQMRRLGLVYRSQHVDTRFHCREIKLRVTANSLAEPGEPGYGQPDEVYYELTFEPAGQAVHAHRLLLSSLVGQDFFGHYDVGLLRAGDGQVPFEVLPSISPESDKSRELVIFFSPPLQPGSGRYILSLTDHGVNLLDGLRTARADYFEVTLARAHGAVNLVQFGVHVPAALGGLVAGRGSVPGDTMKTDESLAAFGPPPNGFRTAGWRASNVAGAEAVRVDFTR